MNTSQTSILSELKEGERIPVETLAYMRARAKRHAYDFVMSEFKQSGITKSELARRLFGGGKGADRVSRMLGGPGNWTIKTLSDLLWAISGGEPTYGVAHPMKKARRNFVGYERYRAERETYSTQPDTTQISIKRADDNVIRKWPGSLVGGTINLDDDATVRVLETL